MKRIAVVIAVFAATGFLFAQEITYSGEIKTGFYIEQEKTGDHDPVATGGMTNNDGDSGTGQGRLRLDFHFSYQNLGLRLRFQIEPESSNLGPYYPAWNFAYAYGNLFNDQLKLSVGILGESPWGTGGPRLRSDPEARKYTGFNSLSKDPYTSSEGLMGLRFEFKPSFVPGLNFGFVLNQPDRTMLPTVTQTFGDFLGESVVGASYENGFFALRAGYRFDSEIDTYSNPRINEGGSLSYRLEEKVLGNLFDGMKVWLNGYYYGIGGEQQNVDRYDPVTGNIISKKIGGGEYFINWLYWLWDTDNYTAQFDASFALYKAYNNTESRPVERQEYQSLEFKPAFYYKFLSNMFQAGLGLGIGMEFGDGKTYKDSPYQYISIEPLLRLNIAGNGYVAAVYTYTDKYAWFEESEVARRGEKSVKHSVNIRAVYAF
jgi:hypothetical protein